MADATLLSFERPGWRRETHTQWEETRLPGHADRPGSIDAAERELWSMYSSQSSKDDERLARNWKGDMDSILIFAGLFTASTTAIIVESYKKLERDKADVAVALLAQISRQLDPASDANTAVTGDEPYSPPTSVVVCNIFLFLSLGFSLASALAATLIEQWIRDYLQETHLGTGVMQARMRAFLNEGLKRFRMNAIVEAIPLLLHISVFFFFAGLVAFLHPISKIVGDLCLAILFTCIALYCIPTLTPIIRPQCPYRTPLTSIGWVCLLPIAKRLRRSKIPRRMTHTLTSARIQSATLESPSRDLRDQSAVTWLIQSLNDDSQVETLSRIIPVLFKDFEFTNGKHTTFLWGIMSQSGLGALILNLLAAASDNMYNEEQRIKRASACFASLWTILCSVPPRAAFCFISSGRKDSPPWFSFRHTVTSVSLLAFKYGLSGCQRSILFLSYIHLLGDLNCVLEDAQSCLPNRAQSHSQLLRALMVLRNDGSFESDTFPSDSSSRRLGMELLAQNMHDVTDSLALTCTLLGSHEGLAKTKVELSHLRRLIIRATVSLMVEYVFATLRSTYTGPLPRHIFNPQMTSSRAYLRAFNARIHIQAEDWNRGVQAFFDSRPDADIETVISELAIPPQESEGGYNPYGELIIWLQHALHDALIQRLDIESEAPGHMCQACLGDPTSLPQTRPWPDFSKVLLRMDS